MGSQRRSLDFPSWPACLGSRRRSLGKRSAHTLRILCAYSAHTRFRVENTLCIFFSTHEIFNKTSPDKNVGTRLDNFAGAAASQVHIERRSRWTWSYCDFGALVPFPRLGKLAGRSPVVIVDLVVADLQFFFRTMRHAIVILNMVAASAQNQI